jgi:hypothetical protein
MATTVVVVFPHAMSFTEAELSEWERHYPKAVNLIRERQREVEAAAQWHAAGNEFIVVTNAWIDNESGATKVGRENLYSLLRFLNNRNNAVQLSFAREIGERLHTPVTGSKLAHPPLPCRRVTSRLVIPCTASDGPWLGQSRGRWDQTKARTGCPVAVAQAQRCAFQWAGPLC